MKNLFKESTTSKYLRGMSCPLFEKDNYYKRYRQKYLHITFVIAGMHSLHFKFHAFSLTLKGLRKYMSP